MTTPLEQLEKHRDNIYLQMSAVGDFSPGMISINFRRCGKKNCVCLQPDHPGHGPQYLWNTTQKGKSRAQNLRMGPELEKTEKEIASYTKAAARCSLLRCLPVCGELRLKPAMHICRLELDLQLRDPLLSNIAAVAIAHSNLIPVRAEVGHDIVTP